MKERSVAMSAASDRLAATLAQAAAMAW